MSSGPLKPQEILEVSLSAAETKAKSSFVKLAVLGFLAGAFIAFAAEGSNMAAFNLLANSATYGLGRALAGAIFGTGLMLVVLAGGELFTGNTLMLGGVVSRRISVPGMLKNWLIVYIFNFIGSVFLAWLMFHSGLFHSSGDLLGAVTIKIAAGKTGLAFSSAFILGILCNWLVCLAVWLAYGADTMAGKIFGIFFPIWLFITSGFEHSVANMYYIPAGILAKSNPEQLQQALSIGVSQAAIDGLNWQSFFVNNLIPVTLGNIIGGGVFVSLAYLLAYHVRKKNA
ncbi:MAG: formate/nitrite transporter family protein [Clostridiales Family XIII bacterium]|nr:formate/nitrite transporter family protein [Clostridiales Family XIII bacterium]